MLERSCYPQHRTEAIQTSNTDEGDSRLTEQFLCVSANHPARIARHESRRTGARNLKHARALARGFRKIPGKFPRSRQTHDQRSSQLRGDREDAREVRRKAKPNRSTCGNESSATDLDVPLQNRDALWSV